MSDVQVREVPFGVQLTDLVGENAFIPDRERRRVALAIMGGITDETVERVARAIAEWWERPISPDDGGPNFFWDYNRPGHEEEDEETRSEYRGEARAKLNAIFGADES